MTWDAYHHREEVLRAVIAEADVRGDGTLPIELPGVTETFGDELALIGALQMRWHTRLSGTIDRELLDQPLDLESAVISVWRRTATELFGIRAILDAYSDAPTTEAMQNAVTKAQHQDWTLLAAMAGHASVTDRLTADVGRDIEAEARAVQPA